MWAQFVTDGETEPADALLLLAEPKELRLPAPNLKIVAAQTDEYTLTLTFTAAAFTPAVWLRTQDGRQGAVQRQLLPSAGR